MSVCAGCGKKSCGGVYTNGDGCSDGKYVGIIAGELKLYCWDCYEDGKAPDLNSDIDDKFKKQDLCGFNEAWIGRCREKKPCEKHKDIKCWKCGSPAVANCSFAGSLVCGTPYCRDHNHYKNHLSGTVYKE